MSPISLSNWHKHTPQMRKSAFERTLEDIGPGVDHN